MRISTERKTGRNTRNAEVKHVAILVAVLFSLFHGSLYSDSTEKAVAEKFSQAEDAFSKALYQEASATYLELAETSSSIRERARMRAAEALALLYRHEEALRTLEKWDLPRAPSDLARRVLLWTEIAREYIRQNRSAMSLIPSESSTPQNSKSELKSFFAIELKMRTPQEWHQLIERSFEQLIPHRSQLVETNLSEDDPIVVVKERDQLHCPSLWDLVVSRWTHFLTNDISNTEVVPWAPETRPQPPLKSNDPIFLSSIKTPQLLARRLLLSDLESRPPAVRDWLRAEAIILPAHHAPKWDLSGSAGEKYWGQVESTWNELEDLSARSAVGWLLADHAFSEERFKDAVTLCLKIEALAQSEAQSCHQLRATIERPAITLQARTQKTVATGRVHVRLKNLKQAHLRIYSLTRTQILELESLDDHQSWDRFRTLSPDLVAELVTHPPNVETIVNVPEASFQFIDAHVEIPALPAGLHAVLVSDRPDFHKNFRDPRAAPSGIVEGVLLNVSDRWLFGSLSWDEIKKTGTANFSAWDVRTGQAAPSATLQVHSGVDKKRRSSLLSVDADGQASLVFESARGISFDPLLKDAEHRAFWSRPIHFFSPDPVEGRLFVETDRALYRPKDTVRYRLSLLVRDGTSWVPAKDKRTVLISFIDPRGEKSLEQSVTMDASGTTQGEWQIPLEARLGEYQMIVQWRAGHNAEIAQTALRIEAFDPPDIELQLPQDPQVFVEGVTSKIKGRLIYSDGLPIPNSSVDYSIVRHELGLFLRGARDGIVTPRFPQPTASKEVIRGTLKTNSKGEFALEWEPEKSGQGHRSRYEIVFRAQSPGARWVSARVEAIVGQASFIWNLEPVSKLFFTDQIPEFTIECTSPGGQKLTRGTRVRLDRLIPSSTPSLISASLDSGAESNRWARHQTVEMLSIAARSTETVRFGSKKLASGHYRVCNAQDGVPEKRKESPTEKALRLQNSPEQCSYFAVIEKEKAKPSKGKKAKPKNEKPKAIETVARPIDLQLPWSEALASQASYRPLETADVLIGSTSALGRIGVEVWHGQTRIALEFLKAGVYLYRLSIRQSHEGDLTLRWYGISETGPIGAVARLTVPYTSRHLDFSVSLPKSASPGQKVEWSMKVGQTSTKKKSAGIGFLSVTDAGLDALVRRAPPWLESLYSPLSAPIPTPHLEEPSQPNILTMGEWKPTPDLPTTLSTLPPFPSLRVQPQMDVSLQPVMAMRAMSFPQAVVSDRAQANGKTPEQTDVLVREDFAKTALFLPQIQFNQQEAHGQFQLPDTLTRWNWVSHVLTSNGQWAVAQSSFPARLPLAIRASAPEFVREGDRFAIRTTVSNHSAKSVRCRVQLRVGGKELPQKPLQLQAGTQKTLEWKDLESSGSKALTVIATVSSDAGKEKLKDAEKRVVSIIPNLTLVAPSAIGMVKPESTTTLEPTLPKDLLIDPRKILSATLALHPHNLGSLVSALPALHSSSSTDLIAVLDRLLPSLVLSTLLSQHGEIAKLLQERSKSKSTPPWQDADPRRLVEMEFAVSQSASSDAPIDWLSEAAMQSLKNDSLRRLEALQTPSGAFAWFAKGQPEPLLSLLALYDFGLAKNLGVSLPSSLTEPLLRWTRRYLSEVQEITQANLSEVLLALDALSLMDPAKSPAVQKPLEQIQNLVERERLRLSPYQKAALSQILWTLGQHEQAIALREQTVQFLRKDEWGGLFFPRLEKSSQWHESDLWTSTAILRLLLQQAPTDARVDLLAAGIWSERLTQRWTEARKSSLALLALMEWMEKRNLQKSSLEVSGTWLGKKLELKLDAESPARILKGASPAELKPPIKAVVSSTGTGELLASVTVVGKTGLPSTYKSRTLELDRKFFVLRNGQQGESRASLGSQDPVSNGAVIEVELTLDADKPLDFIAVHSPRAACFDRHDAMSGWTGVTYRSVGETADSFYFAHLPEGKTTVRYRLRAWMTGRCQWTAGTAQSVLAPEVSAGTGAATTTVADGPKVKANAAN